LEEAEEQLRAALLGLEALLERGDGPVRVSEQGELMVGKLSAEEVPAEVEQVRLGLVELLPRLPITELLIEVDRVLRPAHPRRWAVQTRRCPVAAELRGDPGAGVRWRTCPRP